MKYQKSPLHEYLPSPKLWKVRSITMLIPLALAALASLLLFLIDGLDVIWALLGTVLPLLIVAYFIHSLVFFLLCRIAAKKQEKADGVRYAMPTGVTVALLVWGALLATLTLLLLGMVILFTLALTHM